LFAPFLMCRNCFIALALAVPVAVYSAAQTPVHPPKTHRSAVHHPRAHHPAPPSNPEAQQHRQMMKEEAASRKRNSRATTEGKPTLKEERSLNSEHKAEGASELRSRRHHVPKPHTSKKHPSASHTVGESRLRMERRQPAAYGSRYEEGYRAGFAAGLAARRSEAESAGTAPPVRPALQSASRSLASRSAQTAPASAAQPQISDATVRSTTPVSGDAEAAGEPATPAIERSHSRPENASLEFAPGSHVVPISLRTSMHLLHQPVPAPMRGTLASLERQNRRLDAEGLQRVEDEHDLEFRVARKLLVPLPVSAGLDVNPGLPVPRRYCRPWTAEFLTDLSRMHDAVFHKPLRIDSAVRTVDYQRRLVAINANAAPAEGDVASPHETGAAIDIAKRGMTWREIGWMRRYLTTLQNARLIDVEEEFYQSCFHIAVYDTYGRHGLIREAGAGSGDGTDRTSDTAAAADGAQGQ
jgi:hypothetical protein